MTTAMFKPSRSAALAYFNDEIKVFTDGTWLPQSGHMAGWVIQAQSVVHSDGAGDAHVTTTWGRSKASHVIGPDGRAYDVRALATGGSA